ncbi:hypothetical protein SAMN04487965_2355 [Microbulbifer donghaiensis]|uniref:Secreted protein n=1 Tax=Microbulbifer donghaiensis TaxID=494016 RepID=A0A1M5CZC6_9GAMM|nr:hypothetical protein [Microbulbifer donghaiensis]SHF59997.1 hypothetical protein SAMN04487965_2355 [Microbulbifer donghaiensis]
MKALCFPLLLLACPFAVAENIQLSDHQVLKTALKEVKLISELHGYAIVAGRSCVDCDENTSIYIHKIPRPGNGVSGEEGDPGSSDRYTYPGQYLDYESKQLVEKTRMFYGQCYEGQPSLLWLSEYRDGNTWIKSEYLIVFGDDGLEHRFNENRQPSIFYTENAKCEELPGITAETEP